MRIDRGRRSAAAASYAAPSPNDTPAAPAPAPHNPDCGVVPAAAASAASDAGAALDSSRSHVLGGERPPARPVAASAPSGPSAPADASGPLSALWNATAIAAATGSGGGGTGSGAGAWAGSGDSAPAASPSASPSPSEPPPSGPPPPIMVRAEEALIVIVVLIMWVAAIALFFNRWGKIRMLEPYQPKYEAPHRGSCPLVDCTVPGPQLRSFSKFNLNGKDVGLHSSLPSPHNLLRPRQNSVFVGSSATMVTLPLNQQRKAKSAMDIQTLLLAECSGPASAGAHRESPSASASFEGGPLPDSNFNAALSRLDTFRVTNV